MSAKTSQRVLTVDLLLRRLAQHPEFINAAHKDWEAISRLIPGATARECADRWSELNTQSADAALTPIGQSADVVRPMNLQPRPAVPATPQAGEERPMTGDGSGRHRRFIRTQSLHGTSASSRSGSEAPVLSASQRSTTSAAHETVTTTGPDTQPQQPQQPPLAASSSEPPSMVVIPPNHFLLRVVDDSATKDFFCDKQRLLQEMKYFAEYAAVEPPVIPVRCDIGIFDWLMAYVETKHQAPERLPLFKPQNIISILLSSHFLQMEDLVEQCLVYTHENINVILKTHTSMSAIPGELLERLAAKFQTEEIDQIKDKRDRVLTFGLITLCWKKVELLFSAGHPAAALFRCLSCSRILSEDHETSIACPAALLSVAPSGAIAYHHRRDPNFDMDAMLAQWRLGGLDAKDIFFRVWGMTQYLFCTTCKQPFPLTEIDHCLFHPITAQYPLNTDVGANATGQHLCCGVRVHRFDPARSATGHGCSARAHTPAVQSAADSALLALLEVHPSIRIPWTLPMAPASQAIANTVSPSKAAAAAGAGGSLVFQPDEAAAGLHPQAATPGLVTHVPVDPSELQAAAAVANARPRKAASSTSSTSVSSASAASVGANTVTASASMPALGSGAASTAALSGTSTMPATGTTTAAGGHAPTVFQGMAEKHMRAENNAAVFSAHGLVPPTASAVGAGTVTPTPSHHLLLWDRRLPTRVNQDNQRAMDAQRMLALTRDLVQRRATSASLGAGGTSAAGSGSGTVVTSSAGGATGAAAAAAMAAAVAATTAAAASAGVSAGTALSGTVPTAATITVNGEQGLLSELPFMRMEAKQQAVVNQVLLNKQKQEAQRKKAGGFTRVSSRPTF